MGQTWLTYLLDTELALTIAADETLEAVSAWRAVRSAAVHVGLARAFDRVIAAGSGARVVDADLHTTE